MLRRMEREKDRVCSKRKERVNHALCQVSSLTFSQPILLSISDAFS
jgi:hypothetical protein